MKRSPLKRSGRWRPKAHKAVRVLPDGREILSGEAYRRRCREVWERDKRHCVRCYRWLPDFSTRLIDHRIKRSQGRDDRAANLQTLCGSCHDYLDNRGGKLKEREA